MATTTETHSDTITPEDLGDAPRFIRNLVRFTGKREHEQEKFDLMREDYSLPYAVRTQGSSVVAEEQYNKRMTGLRERAQWIAREWEDFDLADVLSKMKEHAANEHNRTENELMQSNLEEGKRQGLLDARRSIEDVLDVIEHADV